MSKEIRDNLKDDDICAKVAKALVYDQFGAENSLVILEMNFNGKNFLNIFANHDEFFDGKKFPSGRNNFEFVGEVYDENNERNYEHIEILKTFFLFRFPIVIRFSVLWISSLEPTKAMI